jgi:site-specific recombinase XerD
LPGTPWAGIRKKIGWHTFRHTYSTLLITNGEKVKVVQELMRHASSRFTLEIYSPAQLIAKRQAQERPVQALFREESDRRAPVMEGQLELNYLSHNQ